MCQRPSRLSWKEAALKILPVPQYPLGAIVNITHNVCRHTYCRNQAKAGMNPKTLQYLMGHSEIGVTMNTYTHLGLDDAKDEMIRLEELE
ncbi:MAG: tyrosine-type recombinase/integrase [Anaerovoracaceae bacterium]|nr:tyrosine-type recombinase/integrase [Anaerovoracaceae bacterium]